MMSLIPNSVTRSLGRTILKTKKNSPHIFFAGGIVGVVTSTVLACRATLKLEQTVDEIKMDFENVRTTNDLVERTENEHYKDVGYIYVRSAVKLGKLYGPSAAVGVVSIAALTGSHIQLTRRNTALTVTLAAVSKAFEEYRDRVRDVLGEQRELDIYHCMEDVEYEDEKGKKKIAKVVNPYGLSPYARVFDETSSEWVNNAEYNRIFLHQQENYWNHRLTVKGHVFLQEIYDALGFDRAPAGQIVGWLYNGTGDQHIDFNIFEAHNSRFINGHEPSVWLDFNVDGPIFEKI